MFCVFIDKSEGGPLTPKVEVHVGSAVFVTNMYFGVLRTLRFENVQNSISQVDGINQFGRAAIHSLWSGFRRMRPKEGLYARIVENPAIKLSGVDEVFRKLHWIWDPRQLSLVQRNLPQVRARCENQIL